MYKNKILLSNAMLVLVMQNRIVKIITLNHLKRSDKENVLLSVRYVHICICCGGLGIFKIRGAIFMKSRML
jgi:hypothetical protein